MKNFGLLVFAVVMCMITNVSAAADQVQQQSKAQNQVYGSQLMTREERIEYRAKMRSLKTKEERDALRMEHHQKMQERAKNMGKTLPDMPCACGATCTGGCSGACACGGGCGMHGGMSGKMPNCATAPQSGTQLNAASGVHSH